MPVRTVSNTAQFDTVLKGRDAFHESIYAWASKDNASANRDIAGSNQSFDSETVSSNSSKQNSQKDRYVSIYHEQSREEYKKSMVGKAASFGPAKVLVETPAQFLKSHKREQALSGKISKPGQKNVTHSASEKKRPVLWEPRYEPAQPVEVPVRPKRGVKKPTELDCYKEKTDYGKVPDYIHQRKEEINQKKESERILSESQKSSPVDGLIQLPEKDRVEILEGLQETWEKLMTDFQKLPLVTDTITKRNRKVAMENQLKQLEADIEKFSQKKILVRLSSAK